MSPLLKAQHNVRVKQMSCLTLCLGLIFCRVQGDQMIWNKNCPIFWKVAQTVSKQNDAKILNMFFKRLCSQKCYKFASQGIAILGLFYRWPYKSSLIGEKSPNLDTLVGPTFCWVDLLSLNQEMIESIGAMLRSFSQLALLASVFSIMILSLVPW